MVAVIVSLLGGRKVYLWIAAVALVAAGVVYIRHDAVQDERRETETRRLKHEADTHKRIQDAIADPRTPDNIRQRLRELAQ